MSTEEKPTLRWGIIATGLISSWFVADLMVPRPDAKANHIIQAVASSSAEKGKAFVEKHLPGQSPRVYGSYTEAYADPDVDIVYIGTPNSFHKQNCLDAIAQGKNIMCEKSFTLNVKETKEVLAAAEAKGVFIMEAMWTRFFPLVQSLQDMVHKQKVIGDIQRVFCDFSLPQNIHTLGSDSRLRNPALGAGTLLDIGIYSLTWALLGLEKPLDGKAAAEKPTLLAAQTLFEGVDTATSIILKYADGRQGIATSNSSFTSQLPFCRIEGTEGKIIVGGGAAPVPSNFTVIKPNEDDKKYDFPRAGRGFYYEADAVALDIAAGRKQSAVMPWSETVRVMELLDEVRRQGGAKFPQDDQ
ncbi:NAD(P)-binding protein [Sarocladium strictum]